MSERLTYNAQTLEADLRRFEVIYGLSSKMLYRWYRDGYVPSTVPRFEAFVWADTYEEFLRFRPSRLGQEGTP